MGTYGFDEPVLLMRMGASPLETEPTLGEAIAHVMRQPSDERAFFDIISDDGFLGYSKLLEIYRSETYVIWAEGSL